MSNKGRQIDLESYRILVKSFEVNVALWPHAVLARLTAGWLSQKTARKVGRIGRFGRLGRLSLLF